MSHFLARLVDRARGTAPRVEPIIAPRFAPAPVTEIVTEIEAPAPVTSRKSETASRNEAPAREIVRQELEPPRVEEIRREETAVAPDPEKLLVPQEILVPDQAGPIVRRIAPEELTAPPVGNGTRPKRLTPVPRATPPGSPIPAASQPSRVVAGIDDPGHPTAAHASQRAAVQPNELHSESPIVRITIGRIDVRATPAPAASARKSPPKAAPTLTLDAYLKGRKEGRR